ncbi:hypothetical protein CCACVL1_21238 [Corchorus capsularis]|uniref:Cyclin-dependent protein kinase inhibitor SMR3-like n=1 Tax=Corchorus capsularis TaxID=210143 RepID=A0A1R3H7E5_COCAP|nr:hypothetical protein CCACVL1_21238 [Corchorus capsularis]
MSNSEIFLVEDEEQGIEFEIMKRRPPLEFHDDQEECTQAPTADNSSYDIERECNVAASKESEKKIDVKPDDNNDQEEEDGFKTPTSFEHKIPVTKQCPPAPRKPKPRNFSSNKRKASPTPTTTPTQRRTRQQLDLSQEVESLFPAPLLADLHRKIKKARTDQDK